MKFKLSASRRRALWFYLLGQVAILLGAAAMSWMESYLPMALGGSAALMLTAPLVLDLARRQPASR